MGLSPDVVLAHIKYWGKRLNSGGRKYRRHWPGRLFRHEPLESAVKILRDGVLLSRDGAGANIQRDIAPDEIIGARDEAHKCVRLYFRPKSPTQYRIEGIKKPFEIYKGRHAPVLIIFVFKAEDILTQAGTRFSYGNMQVSGTKTYSTDKKFEEMPFEFVYHEGSYDPNSLEGEKIKWCRCAEALLPSPLKLNGHLQWILCRSSAERATLLHLLGKVGRLWSESYDRILVMG